MIAIFVLGNLNTLIPEIESVGYSSPLRYTTYTTVPDFA